MTIIADEFGNEVVEVTSNQTYTGYQLHKRVAKVLEEEGLKTIPPQMIYNYMNNKLIPWFVDPRGQKKIKEEDATKWITKYVAKRKANQTK